MAITESKKQSALEKRLKILRQQVYGKEISQSSTLPARNSQLKHQDSDIAYLRYDLVKILTLSTLAIAIQFVLFILAENHILNLKFF